MCCSLGMAIYTNKTYLSTNNCNITLNTDNSEIVTYYVNNQKYVQTIQSVSSPPSSGSSNNILSAKYSVGNCTIYYNSNDPNDYSINSKPPSVFYIFLGLSCCTCCLILLVSLYFAFLNTHREVAGIQGGVTALQDIASII